MNVISLKTSASGVIYTCPAGKVAEVEMVAIADGAANLNVVSGGITKPWVLTGEIFHIRANNADGAAQNVFAEEAGGGNIYLKPSKIKLGSGDYLSMSASRECSLIIYEETTGTH